MNILLILSGQIKTRDSDWSVEGKCWAGCIREWRKSKEQKRKKMEEEEVEGRAEPRGLEKLQVARDLIAGE